MSSTDRHLSSVLVRGKLSATDSVIKVCCDMARGSDLDNGQEQDYISQIRRFHNQYKAKVKGKTYGTK